MLVKNWEKQIRGTLREAINGTALPKEVSDVIFCQSEVWIYSRWKGDS